MSYYEPIDYFEQYDRYRYEHPQFPGMPLKEDDFYDLVGPTSDTQTYNRVKFTAPNPGDFSQDAFWAADPIIRGPLAEALREAEGDSIGAYDVLNTPDFRKNLADMIGKTEWNQLRAAGILPEDNLPGEELDRMALEHIMQGAENVLATGAPTLQRNAGWMDMLSERFGGRPYPGGELAGFEGPGFGQVGAPQQGGPGGQQAAGPGAGGMPDQRTMQALEDAVVRNPGLAESPSNAYHAALQQRLKARGYRGGGDGASNARYFRENASKKDSTQNRRGMARRASNAVRNMSSRPSGRRSGGSTRLASPNRRTTSNRGNRSSGRSIASYYRRRS